MWEAATIIRGYRLEQIEINLTEPDSLSEGDGVRAVESVRKGERLGMVIEVCHSCKYDIDCREPVLGT